jgi:hypothetical protein
VAVFWVVALCSLVEVHRRFRGACCLHHQGNRPEEPEDNRLHTLLLENLKTRLLVPVLVMTVAFKPGASAMVDLTAEEITSSSKKVLYNLEVSCSVVCM